MNTTGHNIVSDNAEEFDARVERKELPPDDHSGTPSLYIQRKDLGEILLSREWVSLVARDLSRIRIGAERLSDPVTFEAALLAANQRLKESNYPVRIAVVLPDGESRSRAFNLTAVAAKEVVDDRFLRPRSAERIGSSIGEMSVFELLVSLPYDLQCGIGLTERYIYFGPDVMLLHDHRDMRWHYREDLDATEGETSR